VKGRRIHGVEELADVVEPEFDQAGGPWEGDHKDKDFGGTDKSGRSRRPSWRVCGIKPVRRSVCGESGGDARQGGGSRENFVCIKI
jgi:hypothetical protein